MRNSQEREWELSIGPDTVRMLILKAKALSAGMRDDFDAGSEHEIEFDGESRDLQHHHGLAEEETEDLTEREFRALISDLNVDEAAELIALAWIGRGDFDASEWDEALTAAKQRPLRQTARYLLGLPQLADWLEQGLESVAE
ncbi:DUF3775 domain-containing protein [Aquamicrobium terrae]|uniref:DUF3775 domain-containing protein n=1 Tax=Aquamicrobium terrae TaxID=1324945 RepID=A0ABV2N5Q2_9HYPH